MRSHRLRTGQGPGARLLAAGLPDHLIASGDRLVWIGSQCLWDQQGEFVHVVEAEGLLGINACGGRAVAVWKTPDGLQISDGADPDGRAITVVAREVHAGVDWAVADDGSERFVVDLSSGERPKIPVGARDARPRAWAAGAGITWLDGQQVYRFELGGRTRLSGNTGSRVEAWLSGPQGAAVFSTSRGLIATAKGKGLHPLPEVDLDSIRFSADGQEFIASDGVGIVRWNLAEGRRMEHLRGHLCPVGFSHEPILLDEDVGTLRTWSGRVLAGGFSPCAASAHGDRLYGPGGTAWSISHASRVWSEGPLAADHLMATDGGVIQVDERIIGLDLEGNVAFNIPLPIDSELDGHIYAAHWIDGLMYFEVEDGWIQVDFDGRRVGAEPPPAGHTETGNLPAPWCFDEASGTLDHEGQTWPMLFDGAVLTGDGRALAWSEDGVLCALSAS